MQIIKESDPKLGKLVSDILKKGGVISFPTDTVYGIAVDASNASAVDKIYRIKNRSANKPIAIFVKDIAAAEQIFYFSDKAKKIAESFMPGPLTLVLRIKKESIGFLADNLNLRNDGFLGFRIVNKFFLSQIFKDFDGVLAVTSANKSNEKDTVSYLEVKNSFLENEIDLIVAGEGHISGLASTVLKVSENEFEILRHGAISRNEIIQKL